MAEEEGGTMWRLIVFLQNLQTLFWNDEDRILYYMRRLCLKRHFGGRCPEGCKFFMSRNPFKDRAALPEERFKSCPLLDFNDAVLRYRHEEILRNQSLPKGVDRNECSSPHR